MELEAAAKFGALPHVWDAAPRWSRAEAEAAYIIEIVLGNWRNMPEDKRKTLLAKVPRTETKRA